MHQSKSIEIWEEPMGSCPLGGKWYICQAQLPKFIGCCLSDPCDGIGCPTANLTAAGMGTAGGPDASSNDGSYYPDVDCPLGGTWFTCAKQTPSFQGCCGNYPAFDPCKQNGCPSESLYPAAFSTSATTLTVSPFQTSSSPASPSSSTLSSSVPSSSTSSLETSSTSGASSSSQTAQSQTPSTANTTADSIEQKSHSTLPIGAIVGSALGGVIVILLVLLAIFCLRRRKRRVTRSGAVEPYYQPQQNMSMDKAIPSSFFFGASPSDAKVPPKGYRPTSHTPSSPPHSPAPPYQSSPQSPELRDYHEIDSFAVHEVESPPLRASEMPDTSGGAWRS